MGKPVATVRHALASRSLGVSFPLSFAPETGGKLLPPLTPIRPVIARKTVSR
jgi:hypothetical protein